MVTIGMNYKVRAGKESVFESAFANVLGEMQKMPGHDGSRLYRRVGGEDAEYLILSVWTDEKAFQDFIRSERFQKVASWGKENILVERPSHTTYAGG
jgi:heme-degrading monooxygenase HmoA